MKASHILLVLGISIGVLVFLNYQESQNEASQRLRQSAQSISQRTRMDTALILKSKAEKRAQEQKAASKNAKSR